MKKTIGISDFCVTRDARDVLITYSLGSCVGLTLYDPKSGIGAMLHCLLPLSRTDPEKARNNPSMFTDTGIAMLLQKVLDLGADKRKIIAKVAGASQIMDTQNTFKIGERNYTVLRKMLWKNNILIAAEDVGGQTSRTLTLYMADGRTTIKSNGVEKELV